MDEKEQQTIIMNEKSMEVLIAKFIPTSQYFEARFDHLQYQVDEIKTSLQNVDKRFDAMQSDMDKRFDAMQSDMDKRFEQVDKRFEQVDKRFEQVDKRFEQINDKLDKVLERIDVKIDRGLAENRNMSIRLFSFAMVFSAISMAGLLGKFANLY